MHNNSLENRIIIGSREISLTVLIGVCFVTNISQLSVFVENGYSSRISIGIWIIGFIVLLLSNQIVLQRRSLNLVIIVVLFLLTLLFNTIIARENYWSSAHINALGISIFVYFSGCITAERVREDSIEKIIWAYIVSSCIVAAEVYVKYFANGFNIATKQYVYDSKNSLAQILLTAIVLLIFGLSEETKNRKRFCIVSIIIGLLVLICIMKSRASIVGFVVLYIAFLTNKKTPYRYKIISLLVVILFIILLFTNQTLNRIIIQDILLVQSDITNLNEISSGRIALLKNAAILAKSNIVYGIGSKYLDCYPFDVILQFGIVPGVLMWIIAISPIAFSIRVIRQKYEPYKLSLPLLVIAITYVINGFFEALSPIGPGVKCYFLWLLYGITCNQRRK